MQANFRHILTAECIDCPVRYFKCSLALLCAAYAKVTFARPSRDTTLTADKQVICVSERMADVDSPAPPGENLIKYVQCLKNKTYCNFAQHIQLIKTACVGLAVAIQLPRFSRRKAPSMSWMTLSEQLQMQALWASPAAQAETDPV